MRTLTLTIALAVLALLGNAASAETLCPDGTFVPGDSCMLSFDGSHVIGGPKTLPDVVYVEHRSVAVVPLRRYHYRRHIRYGHLRHHRHHIVRVVYSDVEYRIGQPQRNRILDAPPGTPAIEIPRLGR